MLVFVQTETSCAARANLHCKDANKFHPFYEFQCGPAVLAARQQISSLSGTFASVHPPPPPSLSQTPRVRFLATGSVTARFHCSIHSLLFCLNLQRHFSALLMQL